MANPFPTVNENSVIGAEPIYTIPELANGGMNPIPEFSFKLPTNKPSPVSTTPAQTDVNADPNVFFFSNIEGTPYTMKVVIVNTHDRAYVIRPASIKQLCIIDNATSPFHNGHIVLDNSFDTIERQCDAINEQRTSTQEPQKGFFFKGDARDLIYIDIFPNFTANEASAPTDTSDNDINKFFRITIHASIYNTEELLQETPGVKYKKLYFRDLYEQILLEKNSFYSTANFVKNSNVMHSSNAQRGLKTDEAIKTFLTSFFTEEDGYPAKVSDKDEDFDKGATTIFYSSPAGYKGIDTLNYLLDKHVSDASNNYDFAMLELDRNKRTFSLESMSTIFKKALLGSKDQSALNDPSTKAGQPGPYFLETYLLGGYTDFFNNRIVSTDTEYKRYAPYQNTVFLKTAGTINNFTIDMMPGEHTQHLLNPSVVHSYNHNDHEFSIDITDNTFMKSKDIFHKNYVESMNSQYATNFSPGTQKHLAKNHRVEYSTTTDDEDVPVNAKTQRLNVGRNKFLKAGIFLNQAISFKVPGSSHRQANRFLGINRNTTLDVSEFDQRMLGTYYITEVKHVFEKAEYFNEIKAIKTYSFEDIHGSNEDNIRGI